MKKNTYEQRNIRNKKSEVLIKRHLRYEVENFFVLISDGSIVVKNDVDFFHVFPGQMRTKSESFKFVVVGSIHSDPKNQFVILFENYCITLLQQKRWDDLFRASITSLKIDSKNCGSDFASFSSYFSPRHLF